LFGGRRFVLAQAGIWFSYGVISCLAALPGQGWEGVKGFVLFKGVIRPLTGMVTSTLLALIYRRIHLRSITALAPAVLALSAIAGVIWFLVARAVLYPTMPAGTDFWVGGRLFHFSLEYWFVLLAWSAGLLWIHAGTRARLSQEDASRALAAQRSAELEALTYQLNPHLLFNALASLRGLIRRAPDQAENMASQLAAFLRHTLSTPVRGQNSLAAELEVAAVFLEIQRLRFERGIDLETAVSDAAASRAVPALILYPLVENAVKHGEEGAGPLRIIIAASVRDGSLIVGVRNRGRLNGDARPAFDAGRPKLGLRNVRERLALHYPGRAGIDLSEKEGWVEARMVILGDDGS
jgi:two-component system, LytTR family, sensor kinase